MPLISIKIVLPVPTFGEETIEVEIEKIGLEVPEASWAEKILLFSGKSAGEVLPALKLLLTQLKGEEEEFRGQLMALIEALQRMTGHLFKAERVKKIYDPP